MKIADIIIGERFRKTMDGLPELAESIKTTGLVEPISITGDNELVSGYRRLVACRDILGWTEIPTFNTVAAVLAGQYAANKLRKDHTPEELYDLTKAIEKELGKRQGQRTDQLPDNSQEVVKPGEETAQAAARMGGLGSEFTVRQVGIVKTEGTDELRDAMNKGAIKISAAAVIAKKPAEEQKQIVAMPKLTRRKVVQTARAAKASKPRQPSAPAPKRIDPPMRSLRNLPSGDEIGKPPPGASPEEIMAWPDKVGAKVVLHPLRNIQLMKDKTLMEQMTQVVRMILRDDCPDAEAFMASITRMLAHTHQPDAKEPTDRINFAKAAREAQRTVEENIEAAIAKLEAYRTILATELSSTEKRVTG